MTAGISGCLSSFNTNYIFCRGVLVGEMGMGFGEKQKGGYAV